MHWLEPESAPAMAMAKRPAQGQPWLQQPRWAQGRRAEKSKAEQYFNFH